MVDVGDTSILLDTIYVNPPWQGLSWRHQNPPMLILPVNNFNQNLKGLKRLLFCAFR